ncbi:MAG: hypothetical protein K8J31_12745 [Anaerolineae bacterium]|nr:hypothetical protein [Anaerolineae bacterium]
MNSVYSPSYFVSDNRIYQILGFGAQLTDFFDKFKQLREEDQDFWRRIAERIWLTDTFFYNVVLDYKYEDSFAFTRNSSIQNFGFQIQGLELYLLCTCLDAIANKFAHHKPLDYEAWLTAKNHDRNDERQQRDDSIRKLLSEFDKEHLHTDTGFLKANKKVFELYKKSYGGLGQNFRKLFYELPQALKKVLLDTYLIVESSSAPWSSESVAQDWSQKENDNRLRAITDYLWEFRRNQFTHGLEVNPSSSQWLSYRNQNGKQIWVLCRNEYEPWLIRTVIVTLCQKDLGYDRGDVFFERYRIYKYRQSTFRQVCYDLDWNRSWIPKFIQILANQTNSETLQAFHHNPLSTFDIESISTLVRDQLLEENSQYEQSLKSWLEAYLRETQRLNEQISQFNAQYPSGSRLEDRKQAARVFLAQLTNSLAYKTYVDGKQTEIFIDNIPIILFDHFTKVG